MASRCELLNYRARRPQSSTQLPRAHDHPVEQRLAHRLLDHVPLETTGVKVEDTPATSYTVDSDTQITIEGPNGSNPDAPGSWYLCE